MQEKLRQARELIHKGDKAAAQPILAALLKDDPSNELAWLLMSDAVGEEQHRIYCLEQVLKLNPGNDQAKAALSGIRHPLPDDTEFETKPVETVTRPSPSPAGADLETKPIPIPPPPKPTDTPDRFPPPDPASNTATIQAIQTSPLVKKPKRIWINAGGKLDRLVFLQAGNLIVANPAQDMLIELEEQVEQGGIPADLSGRVDGRRIDIGAITLISARARAANLTIRYQEAGKPCLESISFASTASRDEALATLETVLGDDFEKQVAPFRPLQALVFPTLILVLLALTTYIFYLGARDPQSVAAGRYALLKTLVGAVVTILGPVGVLAVGGALSLLVIIWAAMRIANPPVLTVLTAIDEQNR